MYAYMNKYVFICTHAHRDTHTRTHTRQKMRMNMDEHPFSIMYIF